MPEQLTNLEQLLDEMENAAEEKEKISLGVLLEAVGSRSFGPLLVLAGVVTFSPLSGIPGMPTLMATVVVLVAAQLLLGRSHFWFPEKLLKRSIKRGKLMKAVKWMRRPARVVDSWIKPRMTVLVGGPSLYAIAVVCLIIGLGMPVMELVPFSASAAGAAIMVFGLSLIACDGLLAVIAFSLTGGVLGLVGYNLL